MQELDKESFGEITQKGSAVVDFWAPWCGPCRNFAPTFEKVAEETPTVTFAKLNTQEHPEVAQQQGVRAIPTLLFFKDGREADRVTGSLPEDEFRAKVKEVFS